MYDLIEAKINNLWLFV